MKETGTSEKVRETHKGGEKWNEKLRKTESKRERQRERGSKRKGTKADLRATPTTRLQKISFIQLGFCEAKKTTHLISWRPA